MWTLHVEDEEMQRIAREQGLTVRRPELGTRPRVYYKNMDRWTKVFIAGSLECEAGGVTDCVEGARVTLEKDGKPLAEAVSDAYGDFRFSGLEEGSGAYRVRIADQRFAPKALEVALGATTVLGAVPLERRAAA